VSESDRRVLILFAQEERTLVLLDDYIAAGEQAMAELQYQVGPQQSMATSRVVPVEAQFAASLCYDSRGKGADASWLVGRALFLTGSSRTLM
jgi:hypothetical protein